MPYDPISDPAMIGSRIGVALDSPRTPSLRNAVAAAALEVRIPTRFEPLALLPGTPASTSSGTVRIEPPAGDGVDQPGGRTTDHEQQRFPPLHAEILPGRTRPNTASGPQPSHAPASSSPPPRSRIGHLSEQIGSGTTGWFRIGL